MNIIGIGDSITEGLGVKGESYGEIVSSKVERVFDIRCNYINYAGSAMQISDSIKYENEIINVKPDLIFIMHGITEAIIRPKNTSLKYLPSRWKRPGWLDPRPYYSNKLYKRIIQKLESSMRWRTKVLLTNIDKGITWKSKESFQEELHVFIDDLLEKTHAKIILISHCNIDEKFYPGSYTSLEEFKNIVKKEKDLYENDRVHFCDISHYLNKWENYFLDHFHPNPNGHKKIANHIFQLILNENILGVNTNKVS